jgi:hypothetical protein
MTPVFAPDGARRRRHRNPRGAVVLLDLARVLAILLVFAIGLLAIATYGERRAAIRTAETERYLEQFEHGAVAEAWRRLRKGPQVELAYDRLPALPGDPATDIDTVLQYFKRLALCVRMGSCDAALTSARLGDLPWRFRERYYHVLTEAYPDETFDRYLAAVSPRSEVMPHPNGSLDRVQASP